MPTTTQFARGLRKKSDWGQLSSREWRSIYSKGIGNTQPNEVCRGRVLNYRRKMLVRGKQEAAVVGVRGTEGKREVLEQKRSAPEGTDQGEKR